MDDSQSDRCTRGGELLTDFFIEFGFEVDIPGCGGWVQFFPDNDHDFERRFRFHLP